MNRLSELHAQLSDEWHLLNSHWQTAEFTWQNDSRAKVAGGVWNTLEHAVPPALRELEEIMRLVETMERRIEP